MGKADKADEALALWMKANDHQPRSHFETINAAIQVTDPDLKAAMEQKFASYEDRRDPATVLFDMAKNHSWSEEDVVLVSKLTEDDFYKMFKSLRGLELRSVVRKAVELERQGPAGDPRYAAIGKNALLALGKIGEESAINKQRISGLYNIGVPDDFTKSDQPS